MRGFRNGYLGIVVASALVAGLLGCGGGGDGDDLPAGVAAKVGDKVIRESAVKAQLRAAYAQRGGTVKSYGPPNYPVCARDKRGLDPGYTKQEIYKQCKSEYETTRAGALGILVQAEQLQREAKRRGIDPDREVSKALVKIGTRLPPRFSGIKIPTRMPLEFRNGVLRDKLLAAMPLTEAEIQEHGRANADVFYDSETRRAEVVQTLTRQEAREARRQLEDTVAWPVIKNRFGVRPFEGHWTGTQNVKEAHAPHDAFGRSLFSARPHQLIGPIHTLNGWFVFEVLAIEPPRHRRLSAQAHRNVAAYLRLRKLERTLHRHYAEMTRCSRKYETPDARCI